MIYKQNEKTNKLWSILLISILIISGLFTINFLDSNLQTALAMSNWTQSSTQDFENGTVIIANNSPADSVYYNATFFILSQGFQLQQVQIDNSTDHLEYGTYNTTEVPASETGILLISYRQGESKLSASGRYPFLCFAKSVVK